MKTVAISNGDVINLSEAIWSSMLGIELSPSLDTPPALDCGMKVSACVSICGEWEGAVCLDISMDLAREAAAVFLDVAPTEVGAEQILDAAGELANMTAGSLKTILPKPSKVSLPSVATGRDYVLTVSKSSRVLRSHFESPTGTLVISIFERLGCANAAD